MDVDKKTILAFVLIGLVLIFTQTDLYKRWVFGPDYDRLKSRTSELPEFESKDTTNHGDSAKVYSLDTLKNQLSYRSENFQKKQGFVYKLAPLTQGAAEDVLVETNLYQAVLTTRGGTIKSWRLKNFLGLDSNQVQLIAEGGYGNLAITLPVNEDTIDTSSILFLPDKKKLFLDEVNPVDTVTFTADLEEYGVIQKQLVFYYNRYSFDLKIELINMRELISDRHYYVVWKSGLASTEANLTDDMSFSKAYALMGGEFIELDIKREGKVERKATEAGEIQWVATRTKYFAVAILPRFRKQLTGKLQGEKIKKGDTLYWKRYSLSIEMPLLLSDTESYSFTVYLGPLDYSILKTYQAGLDKMMNFGWVIIRPFSKAVLWSFKALHSVIPNYGWVIVIFSILIKVIIYPLTKKSYVSMKQMQTLQPELQALKEKYGNNPQKLNEETMKLYKKRGINPLGGCLPMLLQMPLLYALFIVFRSTIELRGAKFIWWIKDLSVPDTVAVLPFSIPFYGRLVNVLPLFMGATMLIQQKMTVKDPRQKAMVYLMPLFFTLLFNTFPSGLNLYYALFNLFSIIQQKFITDRIEIQHENVKPVKLKKRVISN